MDNDICKFEVIQNPNRRYASTVNLVFFRAVPLTKNFQKYIDGLKKWESEYMKYYPDCQLQVFVDEHVLKEEKVANILEKLKARVIIFKCPEYFIENNFHIGLFGTMIRFYPLFDVNTHPLKVAHIQELEPDSDSVPTFEKLDKLGNMKHGADLIYTTNKFYTGGLMSNKYKFEKFIYYPWIVAGIFSAYEKIPFKVFTDYLDDVKEGKKKFFNIYQGWKAAEGYQKSEHGKYSFGVDEIFLNDYYLGYLIKTGKTIGIFTEYKIAHPVYYIINRVKQNPNSTKILEYILNKKGSLKELLKDFDTLFYSNYESERAEECSKRFYEIIEKYPTWLGKYTTDIILLCFKGYRYRNCVILIKNNKIIDIKDV